MLKKIISMFMLIIIVTSPCVFAEDETMTEEEYSQFVAESLEYIQDNSNISKHHFRVKTLRRNIGVSYNKHCVPTVEEKNNLYELIMVAYRAIVKYGTRITAEEYSEKAEGKNMDMEFCIEKTYFGENVNSTTDKSLIKTPLYIVNKGDAFSANFGYYLCEDKEKVFNEIFDFYFSDDSGFFDENTVPSIYDIYNENNELKVYDRIKFDIKITEETEESVFAYLGNAEIGDTVKCSIEQVYVPEKSDDYFLFNIYEGEKRRSLWNTASDGGNYDRRYNQNFLNFSTNMTYDGSNLFYGRGRTPGYAGFRIEAENKNDDITNLYILNLVSYGMGNSFDKLEAENVTYEYFTENIKQYSRTMAYMFGLEAPELNYDDDDDDIEEKDDKKEDKKEEDKKEDKKEETKNNISVSYMRGDFGNEDQYMDFYVSFIAQADVNISSNGAPEWYKKLGSGVRASVIGITQTVDGDDYQNYTLLCFSGNEGIQWFKSSIMEPTYNEKSERVMKISYSSLISFNGFEMKRDTVNYDTVIVSLCYENDENKTLKSVGFDFGEKQVNITSDYLNCLGGGKIAYEKLF